MCYRNKFDLDPSLFSYRTMSMWICVSYFIIYLYALLFRLVVEGIQSILPSSLPGQEVVGHAWGAVSLSDVLLLVEVKYDVVTHLLYTEMLQEHYSKEKLL